MTLRNRIALAATPWAWRARRSVEALVGVAVLWGVAMLVAVLLHLDLNDAVAVVVNLAFQTTIWYLLAMRPSLRSLRRWDRLHRAPAIG